MVEKKIIIGITGASGAMYGRALLQRLHLLKEQISEVAVIFSDNGREVWQYELTQDAIVPDGFVPYSNQDLFAPPASGSAAFTHMVICPCSMATLAAIANGISNNLMTRAADVMLKERRSLLLVPREMPYSLIHLRNMETITLAGGIICPASPAFYTRPNTLEDAVNTVIEKITGQLGLEDDRYCWGNK